MKNTIIAILIALVSVTGSIAIAQTPQEPDQKSICVEALRRLGRQGSPNECEKLLEQLSHQLDKQSETKCSKYVTRIADSRSPTDLQQCEDYLRKLIAASDLSQRDKLLEALHTLAEHSSLTVETVKDSSSQKSDAGAESTKGPNFTFGGDSSNAKGRQSAGAKNADDRGYKIESQPTTVVKQQPQSYPPEQNTNSVDRLDTNSLYSSH
jgi:hypothetical protein